MGFFSELKKLTTPYDDDDDFFDGSDESFKAPVVISEAQKTLESTFAADTASAPEPDDEDDEEYSPREGGFFSALTGKKNPVSKPKASPFRERTVNFNGSDTQVILFNPKTFEESGELVNHLSNCRSVVMTLEGVDTENARRLLDFMSGIAFALQGKITPISAKTYFITPQNVNVVGAQGAGIN